MKFFIPTLIISLIFTVFSILFLRYKISYNNEMVELYIWLKFPSIKIEKIFVKKIDDKVEKQYSKKESKNKVIIKQLKIKPRRKYTKKLSQKRKILPKKLKIVKNSKKNIAQRKKLVEYALKFNGRKKVRPGFRNDCSGFVKSIFFKFNINLFNVVIVKEYGEWLSGTKIIYNYVKEHGQIFRNKLPKPGDIIFFDNTTDRNRDGKVNDDFTHIAIVVKVSQNRLVHYIHKSNRGINIMKMSLKYKNNDYFKGRKVNSYLRRKRRSDKNNTPYLSSQMFRCYGSLFK